MENPTADIVGMMNFPQLIGTSRRDFLQNFKIFLFSWLPQSVQRLEDEYNKYVFLYISQIVF
jgi:hypothetical protein